MRVRNQRGGLAKEMILTVLVTSTKRIQGKSRCSTFSFSTQGEKKDSSVRTIHNKEVTSMKVTLSLDIVCQWREAGLWGWQMPRQDFLPVCLDRRKEGRAAITRE